jgi:diguanylate cyclase (GGDEF)-like protein/PAS domain S-box-containing protein
MLGTRRSLFGQLVVPFVALVSLLVALTTWNAFNSGKRTADEISSNLLKNVLVSTENATRDWLASGQSLVDSVASAVSKDALPINDIPALERHLYSLVTAARPGSYIYIGYPDGRYVGVSYNEDGTTTTLTQEAGAPVRQAFSVARPGDRSNPLPARTSTYDARTRPWYKLASASQKALWTPVYSSASKKILEVSYAAPIRDAKGTLLGVVCTDVPLGYLSSFLAKQSLPKTGLAYLTDNTGFLLATSRKSALVMNENNDRIKAASSNDKLISESARALNLGEIDPKSPIPEETVIVASSAIPAFRAATSIVNAGTAEYNWSITVAADEEEFVGRIKGNFSNVIALGFATVLGAIALGAWLVRKIVGDIKQVKHVAERIGAGDLSASVVLPRSDELGQLSQSVETMRTQLATSRSAIEQHALELEARVDARTAELSLRNAELQREMAERERVQRVANTLSRAVSETSAAVYIVDERGIITYANTGAEALAGISQRELVGRAYATLYASAFPAERRHPLDSALTQNRRWTGIVNRAKHDGSTYMAEVVINPITNENGERTVVCVENDVTEREAAAAVMRRDIITDPLTGLGTRRAFDQLMAELKQRALSLHAGVQQPFSIMFMDLDGFKPINDNHGHDAGDSALRIIADRIRSTLRREDTAFRFGGDEFVAVVPGTDVLTLAHRICERMTDPINVAGNLVQVGISIGVAQFPEHGSDVDQLLRGADQAMYISKATGRGGVTVWVPNDG